MARRPAAEAVRILRISADRIPLRALAEAVRVLRAGGVVAFPTETAYGLAADPTDEKAVARIYAIKGRSARKGLPLVAASRTQVARIAALPPLLARVARRHWPGPLSVVVPLRAASWRRYRAVAERGTIAVRVSGASIVRALARAFGRPLTATSANRSGAGECYSGRAVRRAFAGRTHAPDLLLDVGRIPKRRPSTLVTLRDGTLQVLRQGRIKV